MVALTAPFDGASLDGSFGVALVASVQDSNAFVTKVEFFADGTKLGEATTAPYSLLWPDPTVGSHTLTARVTDELDANATATAINVTVRPPAFAAAAYDFEAAEGFAPGALQGQGGWSGFAQGVMVTSDTAESGTASTFSSLLVRITPLAAPVVPDVKTALSAGNGVEEF